LDKIPILFIQDSSTPFFDPRRSISDGVVAVSGDLSVKRLKDAYENGIFPWFNEGDPILWWSPDPRFILNPYEIKVSNSLKRSLKKFEIRFDSDFKSVINECANQRKNKEGTWINEQMIEAYIKLHEIGVAHSVESYFEGKLVGGLYGVVVGGVFCGESMFFKKSDASKAALVALCRHLIERDFDFIDCQTYTPHLESLGAKLISRDEFIQRLYKSRLKKLKF